MEDSALKPIMGFIALAVLVLVVLMGLGWVFAGNDFFMFRFFAPKEEAVRRKVFEETKSYNQGMIQELQAMQLEYIKGNSEVKEMMSTTILHRCADYPEDRLPEDLRKFVHQLKVKKGLATE